MSNAGHAYPAGSLVEHAQYSAQSLALAHAQTQSSRLSVTAADVRASEAATAVMEQHARRFEAAASELQAFAGLKERAARETAQRQDRVRGLREHVRTLDAENKEYVSRVNSSRNKIT